MQKHSAVRYGMNFTGKWADLSALCAGVSFFLVVLHYYVFGRVETAGAGEKVFSLLLPMVLLGAYALLLRVIRLDVAIVYCVMAGLHGLCAVIASFGGHGVGADVADILCLLAAIAALTVTLLGLFPGKWIAAAIFALWAVLRFFLREFSFGYSLESVVASMPELARLLGILCMGSMCAMLKGVPRRQRKNR